MAIEGDFYEDDEPIEKIVAAFEAGPHGLTGKPAGRTDYLRLPGLWGTVPTPRASTKGAPVSVSFAD